MEKNEYTQVVVGAVAVAAFLGLVGCGLAYWSLHQQLAEIQSEIRSESRATTRSGPVPMRPLVATPVTPAASDSVEGQLRAEGKRWERSQGAIEVGGYVEDILAGRFNQPQGRGTIGKVVSVDEQGDGTATVDFGRGFVVPISKGELRPVIVTEEDHRL